MRGPELAAPQTPFASVLLGLLGATQPVRGSVRGPGSDPSAVVAPNTAPLAGIPKADPALLRPAPLGAAEKAALAQAAADAGPNSALAQYQARVLGGEMLTPDSNPFLAQFAEAANRRTQEAYEEIATRVLPSVFAKANHNLGHGGSSAFARAQAIEARGFAQALADQNAQIFSQAYEAERGRQQAAAQQEVQRFESVTLGNLQSQSLPRLVEQYGLDQGLAEFRAQVDRLTAVLQILAGVSQPVLGQQKTETKNPQVFQPLDLAGGVAGFVKPPVAGG